MNALNDGRTEIVPVTPFIFKSLSGRTYNKDLPSQPASSSAAAQEEEEGIIISS